MEPKTSSTASGAPIEMDAVAWVRGIRDAMYERTKTMSREDFAAYITRTAATVTHKDAAPGDLHDTG